MITFINNCYIYRVLIFRNLTIIPLSIAIISLLVFSLFLYSNHFGVYAQNEVNNLIYSNGNDTQTNAFSVYQNTTTGITISYPSNWTKLETSGNETFALANSQFGGLFFIIVDKLKESNLEDHSVKYIQNINKTYSYDTIFGNLFNITEFDRKYTLDGNPAHKLIYVYPCMLDLAQCAVLDIWTESNEKVIHVIYKTPPPHVNLESDPSYSLVMDMIKSFKLHNGKG